MSETAYVPTPDVVRTHVAAPAVRVVFEVLQAVMPAEPLTDQVIVPVGAFNPEGPVTFAVKVTDPPGDAGFDAVVESLTTLTALAGATATVSAADLTAA